VNIVTTSSTVLVFSTKVKMIARVNSTVENSGFRGPKPIFVGIFMHKPIILIHSVVVWKLCSSQSRDSSDMVHKQP
jgi:hypothetical protein